MAYLIDTNVLITVKRIHYGFDFCPGFWDWIVAQHRAGKVYSIERVYGELRMAYTSLESLRRLKDKVRTGGGGGSWWRVASLMLGP
jgi:hypothetical protein